MRRRFGASIVVTALALACATGCSSANQAASAASPGPVQTTDPAADNYSYPAALTPSSPPPSAAPVDGGSYNNADEIEIVLTESRQECSPGDTPTLSDFPGATDAVQCSSPDGASQDTQIAVFKSQGAAQAYGASAIVGLPGMDADTTALVGRNWVLTTTSSTYAQAVQQILGGNLSMPVAAPSPTPAATPAPEQVTFHCTGNASDGVDITYGANGSEHSASSLPFTHVDKLDPSAQYYVTTAQLQGGGSVSCTTTVQTDDLLGYAQTATNSGSADGGYNIASAEVCSGINDWEKC